MADILLGLLAIFAGGAMLLAGLFVLRLVIPIWGFFAGFAFGAGLVASFADERFLGTVLGWVLGLVFALLFAVFAYLYYYVAVVLAMGAFGFAIGAGLVVALGIDWNWVAVLAGLVVGLIVGLVAVFTNLPMIVLVIFGSVAGAVGVVGGLMLLVGSLNSADFSRGDFTDTVANSFGVDLAAGGARPRRDPHPGQAAGADAPGHPGDLVRRGPLTFASPGSSRDRRSGPSPRRLTRTDPAARPCVPPVVRRVARCAVAGSHGRGRRLR